MTWILVYRGEVIASGSYWGLIGEAEEQDLCRRQQHPDGTELAPKWAKDLMLIPAIMWALIEGNT
jgi:hypothetical protein